MNCCMIKGLHIWKTWTLTVHCMNVRTQGPRKVQKFGWAGPSSDRRSFHGTGFAFISPESERGIALPAPFPLVPTVLHSNRVATLKASAFVGWDGWGDDALL